MDTPLFSPATLDDFFDLRWEYPEARLLAGGTDLLVRLKDSLSWPVLIDISGLQELQGISANGNAITIGALTTYTELLSSDILKQHASVLLQAAQLVGSPQIRNRGTIGGNIANGSPAGDTLPPLYVLRASVVTAGSKGSRKIPIEEFFTGPGKTVLLRNEIIVSIHIPIAQNNKQIFLRLGQRKALAISKVSIAVSARIGNERIDDIRIALGSVGPTVIRANKTEELLKGAALTDASIQAAACEAVETEAVPISDIRSDAEYRRRMCGVLLKSALRACL
jgi:xanthine dehydrogenase FAD-binding subunit